MSWLAHIAPTVQPATLKAYLTHVKALHTEADLDSSNLVSPVVQRLLRGIKRYHREKGRKPKQPITLSILAALINQLQPNTLPLHRIVHAASCLAFSALLRCGEFTTKDEKFSPTLHLTCSSITFIPDINNPQYMRLILPASKTDPFRKGVTITIASAPGQPTCPAAAIQKLFQQQPTQPNAPLFKVRPGIPLTRDLFISTVRLALAAASFDCALFSGHSFCCGSTTSAAQAGFSDREIQLLGRWRSNAYKLYIETDLTHLLQLSSLLHWAPPPSDSS